MIKKLTALIDTCNNAVPKISTIKRFVDYLSVFGYDSLMICVEETYKIDGEPKFAYMRGAYSKEEIKSLDDYCKSKNIELIPSIQTLAHLTGMFKHAEYFNYYDIDDTLLLCEKSYELIEKMISSISDCFSSRTINLGMDEAKLLGRGNYLKKNPYEEKRVLFLRHLERVIDIAKKYGYTQIKVWHDGVADAVIGDNHYYSDDSPDKSKKISEDVIPIYWDYGNFTKNNSVENFQNHIRKYRDINGKIAFAGGLWKWSDFIPDNYFSIKMAEIGVKACENEKVDEYIATIWSDGSSSGLFSILPSLWYTAVYAKDKNKATADLEFKELTGYDVNDFLVLDEPNRIVLQEGRPNRLTSALFFSDILQGQSDHVVPDGISEHYKNTAKKLSRIKGDFDYLFKREKTLCDFMAIKADIGVKSYTAYKKGDRKKFLSLSKSVLKAVKLIEKFEKASFELWSKENKSFGYECFLYRLGGVRQRLCYIKKLFKDYAIGKIEVIEEFEERLDVPKISAESYWINTDVAMTYNKN